MSSARPTPENIQTTINSIDIDFAGRKEFADYDDTKLIHIHRRNRAFVWNTEIQQKLLDSIIKGYYIPPIICSSNIENGVEKRYVMEGGNRITTFRRILTNKVKKLTDEEYRKVISYPMTIVVMRNLTPKQQREMFRRLNKSVRVSDGQLFAMSEDDSPLVQEAIALLKEDKYPLRELMITHFGELKDKDTDSKSLLANAVGLISGALYGPKFITSSFNTQEEKIELTEPLNRTSITTMLGNVFEVFSMADQKITISSSRQKKGQFTLGKYLGAILYDLHTNPGMSQKVQKKWCNYLIKVRKEERNAEEVVKIKGAQNLNADKLKRISESVRIFNEENRIASPEELKHYHHIKVDFNSSDNDSEEDNSDVEEEEEEQVSIKTTTKK